MKYHIFAVIYRNKVLLRRDLSLLSLVFNILDRLITVGRARRFQVNHVVSITLDFFLNVADIASGNNWRNILIISRVLLQESSQLISHL